MRTRTKVVSVAAILSAAALGGGIAQTGAAANSGAKPAVEAVQTVDTDNVQEGDQTTPDAPAAHPASARTGSARATTHAASLVKTSHVTVSGSRAAAASETAGENAGESAGENEQESEAANDGPGGHQDPPGDVQHEGGNNEQ
jgi:hypothetical protein